MKYVCKTNACEKRKISYFDDRFIVAFIFCLGGNVMVSSMVSGTRGWNFKLDLTSKNATYSYTVDTHSL